MNPTITLGKHSPGSSLNVIGAMPCMNMDKDIHQCYWKIADAKDDDTNGFAADDSA